jgi:N utilization substance protein B
MNRTKLRENTFKMLYCNEFHSPAEMPKQCEMFWEELYYAGEEEENNQKHKAYVKEEDRDYIAGKVKLIIEKKEEIDSEINKAAVGWTTERMSKVDLTILRLAYYEMKIDEEVPEKVAVDQAVELAKKYGSDESPAFINGILAKLF